jgi:hypothetical protein
MERRPVLFREWIKPDGKTHNGHFAKEYTGKGIFHQWANGYEEFNEGPGNYTYAIVEQEDGTITEVFPRHLKFEIPLVEMAKLEQEFRNAKHALST